MGKLGTKTILLITVKRFALITMIPKFSLLELAVVAMLIWLPE